MGFDDIDLPTAISLADAARAVDETAVALDLRVTSRGTLAQYPGSIHWHIKRGKEPGTLEITLLNRERRIGLAVRINRQGNWTSPALEAFATRLRNAFGVALPEVTTPNLQE